MIKKIFLVGLIISFFISGCGSINYHAKVSQGIEPEHSVTWDVPIVDFNRIWRRLLDR